MCKRLLSVKFAFRFLFVLATILFFFIFFAPNAKAQICATPGQDGPTNASISINTYYPPSGVVNLATGTNTITLGSVPPVDNYGNNFGLTKISAGDLLMIIQMQDAQINSSNSTLYGSGSNTAGPDGLGGTGFTSLGSAGKFEFLVATNSVPLAGGILTFRGAGVNNGTVNSYSNTNPTVTKGKSSFQVIRVTQYSNFVLSSNISPPPFNGSVGGIIAFDVAGIMDFNGHVIDVTAKGFRGGYSLRKNPTLNYRDIYVTAADDSRTSGKGEGVAGTPRYMWDGFNQVDNLIEGLPGGSAGRGAPANAGGGGNDTNSGGGGGANGGAGGVGAWGYEPYGGTYPNGGRPGSGIYSSGTADVTRLIMGGGGGGGHANDALTGVKGGVGGGIVFINTKTIIGNATILANGANGAPGTFGGNPDGSGGGGAGGTVFIRVSQPNPAAAINISAIGGRGGNTEGDDINGVQPHGPGGGGGGGIALYDIASGTKNINVSAGAFGKTNSGNGGPHHAEGGKVGINQVFNSGALPPYLQSQNETCYPELVTELKEADPLTNKFAGFTATFTVTITNIASGGNAGGVIADVMLPNGLSFKSATVVYTSGAGGPAVLVNNGTSKRPLFGNFNIAPGAKVTINLIASIDCDAYGTYSTSAQALYLDPTRNITDANRLITAANNAFPGANTRYQNLAANVPGKNYDGSMSYGDEVNIAAHVNNSIKYTGAEDIVCAGSFDPAPIKGIGVVYGVETYQWQSSADGVTFTDIAGATGVDYDPPVITATTFYRRIVFSGTCSVVGDLVGIIVLLPIENNLIITNTINYFCNRTSFDPLQGSMPTGSGGTFDYQWQSSADGITFTNIAGAKAKDYTPSFITGTTYYRRIVMSFTCQPSISDVITITLAAPISNNQLSQPAVTAFCGAGDPDIIIGNIPTGGDGTYTYQWQVSFDDINYVDIAGATQQNYDPGIITRNSYYRRRAMSGTCEIISNAIGFTILPQVTNNSLAAPVTSVFCADGDPASISGSLPVGGMGTYSYQWQISADGINFTDILSATAKDYDPPIIIATRWYRRIVTSGSCSLSISNTLQFSLQPPITNNQITAPTTTAFCGNGDPDKILGATPTGGNGTYAYQWQSSLDGVNFTDIPGATLQDYDPSVINATTYYQRKVTSSVCEITSNVVTIAVQQLVANNQITAPVITAFCDNGNPTVIVGSVPSGGDGTYNYQWQIATDGINYSDVSGANGKNYDPPVINTAVWYRRIVSSGCDFSVSNIVSFSLQPPITNNQIAAPTTTAFCGNGDPDKITGTTPTGGNGAYSFQWQSSADGVNFSDLAGATQRDYDPVIISANIYLRRRATSGTCEAFSNNIQFTVQPVLSSNTITPPVTTIFCAQGNPALIAGNIPPGAFTYNYQWQSSADNLTFTDIPGAVANNYDPPVVTVTTYYRRIVSSSVCVVPLISNVVFIQINPPLSNNTITAPPVSAFCNTGDAAAIAGSTPLGGNGTYQYQWQSSTDNVSFNDISGANQRNYNPPALNSSVYYRRIITSGVCNVPLISNTIKITVDPLVANNVLTSPAITAFCGNSQPGLISGSVPSGGNGAYNYQWQTSVDNVTYADIPGASQKDYDPGTVTSSRFLRRIVTSGACATPLISNVVAITVNPPVANNVVTAPAITSFCASGDAALITGNTPMGGNGIYAFQWQRSADNVNFSDISGAIAKDYDPQLESSTVYYRRWVTSGTCAIPVNSNVVVVTIDVMPVINLPTEVTICRGENIVLNASGAGSYQWSPAAGLSATNIGNPTAAPLTTTTYTVIISNGACNTTKTITVNVIQPPTVNLGDNKEILKGNSVTLTATITGQNLKYSWFPATYLSDPTSPAPVATPSEDITYTLTVTSENNCFTAFDDIFIKVYPKITPATAFTPNNDGINDVWEIPGLSSYNSSVVSIFNRYGQLLHQSIGNNKSWDGTYQGKIVPFGTYYYTIDLKNGKVLSGWVVVQR